MIWSQFWNGNHPAVSSGDNVRHMFWYKEMIGTIKSKNSVENRHTIAFCFVLIYVNICK